MFSDYEKLNDLENLFQFEDYEQHLNTISAEIEKLKFLMNECQNEQDSLKQQLAETKEETKMLLAKEEELKQLIQNLDGEQDNDGRNTNQIEELPAYIRQFSIKEITTTDEGEVMDFVFRVNQDCSFRILKSLNNRYELLDVLPPHPNMEEMRKDLLENQDVRGLLMLLRSYFSTLAEPNKAQTESNINFKEQNVANDKANVANVEARESANGEQQ